LNVTFSKVGKSAFTSDSFIFLYFICFIAILRFYYFKKNVLATFELNFFKIEIEFWDINQNM